MPQMSVSRRGPRRSCSAAFAPLIGLITGILGATSGVSAQTITFVPGTYYLDDYVENAPVGPPTDTLVVTVSGGVASFVLTGTDTATFTVPDNSIPTGTDIDNDGVFDPYYLIPGSSITTSWDPTTYEYLTFWSASIGGGVTAGAIPGDFGANLFDTSGSTVGPSQVFAVPEPSTWTMFVVGLAIAGALTRWRRRNVWADHRRMPAQPTVPTCARSDISQGPARFPNR